MDRYDAEIPPDPKEWLALDEDLRSILMEDYHRDARIKMPKRARRFHAVFHTVVENQLALDQEPVVRDTLKRLMAEGLARHDGVHAIGSIVASHVLNIVEAGEAATTDHAAYYEALKALTAAKWRSG